jgi:hypothetical protein
LGIKKDFFFEKKKQKTFAILAPNVGWLRAEVTKVFWFFFSKKNNLLFDGSLENWLAMMGMYGQKR